MNAPATVAIRNVLVATDFSRCSDHAIGAALALARHFGARLHMLHVVPNGLMRKAAADRLGAVAKAHEARADEGGVPSKITVAEGLPASEIVSYATREPVDLIVLGTHGRTGLAHVVMGSVAEAVVRTAPCQVLTIPMREERPEAPAHPAETAVAAEASARTGCLVCAKPSTDRICEACATRIRGQALERMNADEKAGRIGATS